jgi:hypothetical protein
MVDNQVGERADVDAAQAVDRQHRRTAGVDAKNFFSSSLTLAAK